MFLRSLAVFFLLGLQICPLESFASASHLGCKGHFVLSSLRDAEQNDDTPMERVASFDGALPRRSFVSDVVSSALSLVALTTNDAVAGAASLLYPRRRKPSLYVVDTKDDDVKKEQVIIPVPTLGSEYALLDVLPVKNAVFQTLKQSLESLSVLRAKGMDEATKNSTWIKAQRTVLSSLSILDNKRSQLEPAFNPEDSTIFSITKGERGEILIEDLRSELVQLVIATNTYNTTRTLAVQKSALLALSDIGELLVKKFPYDVPNRGKFSFLPRLLGRAKVTFRLKRNGIVLGDLIIVADGFVAPITAGNFVDLSLRNFYTGLPIKSASKKFGPLSEPVPASIKLFGSFNEGFYDPLTAKLRKIPLEVIRLERGPKLSYSTRGLSESSLSDMDGEASVIPSPSLGGRTLVSFITPGLVGFNHPDQRPNSGSSEFFCLTSDTFSPEQRKLFLDGEYAPFGFVVEGYDLLEQMDDQTVIESTVVDDFGRLNLVKPTIKMQGNGV